MAHTFFLLCALTLLSAARASCSTGSCSNKVEDNATDTVGLLQNKVTIVPNNLEVEEDLLQVVMKACPCLGVNLVQEVAQERPQGLLVVLTELPQLLNHLFYH